MCLRIHTHPNTYTLSTYSCIHTRAIILVCSATDRARTADYIAAHSTFLAASLATRQPPHDTRASHFATYSQTHTRRIHIARTDRGAAAQHPFGSRASAQCMYMARGFRDEARGSTQELWGRVWGECGARDYQMFNNNFLNK